MKVENMNGKVYDVDVTGKGIEPLSAGEFFATPPKYFIGLFDNLDSKSKKLTSKTKTLNLILLTDSKELWDLAQCWILEAIYEGADSLSIPKKRYTKQGVVVNLPESIQKSNFNFYERKSDN